MLAQWVTYLFDIDGINCILPCINWLIRVNPASKLFYCDLTTVTLRKRPLGILIRINSKSEKI